MGRPCPELACALEPLHGHGMFIGDGPLPQRSSPVDARTATVCFMPDYSRATAVVKSGRGFRVRPFPEAHSLWEASFLDLYGLSSSFSWAEQSQHFIEGGFRLDDVTFVRALKLGEDAVDAWCDARGITERAQLKRVSKMGSGPFGGFYTKEFFGADYRKCVFNDELGYGFPVPASGDFWSKGSVLVPKVGLVDYWGAAPRGPEFDWYGNEEVAAKCRYGGFDFLGPGESLLDNLLTFYDYPEGGYEYDRPTVRRQPGGGA